MTRSNPVSWLARHIRRGVTDLPRNIVWVVDTTVEEPGHVCRKYPPVDGAPGGIRRCRRESLR